MTEILKEKVKVGDSQFKTAGIIDVRGFPQEVQTKILSQLNFRREVAEIDGREYIRDARRKIVYRKTTDGKNYECVDCGSVIQTSGGYRPLHEGPFDGAGFGEVFREEVPYCPKCEQPPQFYTTPIRIPTNIS